MSKEWMIPPPWTGLEEAVKRLRVSPLVAQILHNRQLAEPGAAGAFLDPQLKDLIDPEALPGATAAAERIAACVSRGEKIVLYGDYDVDGIMGVSILYHVLRLAGATVDFYVPHRLEEGYGLNAEALAKLAEQGAKMVVTVDCGVTSCAEADQAKTLGVELIITDHHMAKEQLPAALIVHPGLEEGAVNPHLCGAGVAFKLAWAVARRVSGSQRVPSPYREFLVDALCLAALGTIADVVPLVGENRIITRFGLAGLPRCGLAGVRALIDSANLRNDKIDAYHVGFLLAPRVNAAGRMGHARLAVEMFARADEARAREIAMYLEEQNAQRQAVGRKTTKQACELVERLGMDADSCHGIVLAEEGWHAGVIGIVASRLVDQYRRPTVMIAMDGDSGQGSARSVAHFQLHEVLSACGEHLETFGGHAMAAGLRIRAENVGPFREAFTEIANNKLTPADLRPRLRLDAQVTLGELSEETVERVLALGPFGMGNPKPRLATDWLSIDGEPRCVGKNGNHLQFAVRDNGTFRKAIGFGMGEHLQDLLDHRQCRVAFEPIINDFNGRRSVELQIQDIQFPGAG